MRFQSENRIKSAEKQNQLAILLKMPEKVNFGQISDKVVLSHYPSSLVLPGIFLFAIRLFINDVTQLGRAQPYFDNCVKDGVEVRR